MKAGVGLLEERGPPRGGAVTKRNDSITVRKKGANTCLCAYVMKMS